MTVLTTVTRKIDGTAHLLYEQIQTEMARQRKYSAEQKFYYESARKVEAETSNKMIARLEESRVTKKREEYYAEQIKQIKVNTTKVEAETKILVEHVAKEHSQGHLYNAGTTLACLGCITGLSVLGVQGFKKVQELRG